MINYIIRGKEHFMECLYKTTFQINFEEYKKFNYAMMKKKHRILMLIIFELILVLYTIISQNIFNIILIILLPFFLWYNIKKSTEKYYESNELIQKLDVDYEFYKTYFVEKAKMER